ncbi:MAG: flagellar biosynthesis protein FlhA [Gammaproteobacteria bacterium]|nr:flagellar biosynthesis protein FlhA [Gammaproteobacteria bacterium]
MNLAAMPKLGKQDVKGILLKALHSGLGAPVIVIAMMGMMIVPMPALVLDLAFTFNIALSLIIMLVVIYVMRPLDFAAFPTVLLVATLLRLALNVASTRVVLLEGHNGGAAAGKVIESFGEFVIGGNFAVGLVVFAILMVINFAVVTKGAGRISEVTARFTLDAMPGKQMSIDADLNAGLIDADTARKRREEIASESEFYGAMDGASKFVKGDAIAGLIILLINIFGGLLIGMMQHDLDFQVALERYVLLTIGDGLVAQIPSLLLSTASAVIITRVSASEDMGEQMSGQLFGDPRPLAITAGILGVIGVIPGMPNAVFLSLAVMAAGLAYWMHQLRLRKSSKSLNKSDGSDASAPEVESAELTWDDVQSLDVVSLEVGYGLIPLVASDQGGELMSRIKGVRKKLSKELGFLVQPVHIHDNLSLGANQYRINILGVSMGEGEVNPNREMAINPGNVYGTIPGLATKDPAFGLDAVWIQKSDRENAQALGYTVVDTSTVVATHLSQLMKTHASKLLGHDEVQRLLDSLASHAPKLVEGLVPDQLPLSVVVKVLQGLLDDEIPLRDMRSVVETLADAAHRTKEPQQLLAEVRSALGRMIVQSIAGNQRELATITLDPQLEQLLLKSLQGSTDGGGVEPGLADRMLNALRDATEQQQAVGETPALLAPPAIRSTLARWLRHSVPSLKVLAYNEVPEDWNIRIVSTVGA